MLGTLMILPTRECLFTAIMPPMLQQTTVGEVQPGTLEEMPGVQEVIRVSKPYKLITLDLRPEKTVVRLGDAAIGGDELAIIAGPCAVESHAQAFAVAEAVRRSGARFFRGGGS